MDAENVEHMGVRFDKSKFTLRNTTGERILLKENVSHEVDDVLCKNCENNN